MDTELNMDTRFTDLKAAILLAEVLYFTEDDNEKSIEALETAQGMIIDLIDDISTER